MVTFPGGEQLPSIGLGTWRMGESSSHRDAEVAVVRSALELGYRVIDTAEMYGEGGAEKIVGAALGEAFRAGQIDRAEVFVVSKVYPQNATAAGTVAACERSMKRLGLDQIDAYLLHWRGGVPLAETVAAFESLRAGGRIRHWGVSNFDLDDMRDLMATHGGEHCATNQIYYSLSQRGPAFELLPWQQQRNLSTMAYSPIDQGALAASKPLLAITERRGATPAQMALAWLIEQNGVMAIPKAVSGSHLRENLEAMSLTLSAEDRAALDAAFAPPLRKTRLAML